MLKITLVWVYLPIIAGILFEMMIQFSIAYLSWIIFNSWSRRGWIESWIVIFHFNPSFRIDILFIVEICIFTIGFLLFLYGLVYIVKARKNRIDLIQKGPYKYIHHPQNLGILIMSFSFVLYIPEFIYMFLNLPYDDTGLRIADFLSWILFGLIIIVICDFEERKMIKKFPVEYNNYRNKTGFFCPKIRKQKLIQIKNKKTYYLFRYSLLIFCFILLILITNFIAKILVKNRVVMIYF